MDLDLTGRTALVTGASSGIGRSIAWQLALEGARVAVSARREERLTALADEVTAAGGSTPIVIAHDLLQSDAADQIASEALRRLGSVDILVNNAGQSSRLGVGASDDDWVTTMTLNFARHRQLTERLVPAMRERGWGRIIAIGSGGNPAKAALASYMHKLADQVAREGITANCVAPGKIMSEQMERRYTAAERAEYGEQHIAIGSFGEPEDLAHLVCFLSSPLARYITGTVVVVDGGLRER